ncbi:hypothetical protein K443DRAFT_678781 [Laccaria amethystina LaAM-08-1]|jgi:hypothetical protein|uniref:Uncharacterized protein n=1 Tax=Laccaria amethystina LaAM-08-1 TaxID=1095629 RepID=A0A0C9WRA0_9AGAR|nr:hypothetical protein K443DRAFT_678781 [Laccaria amethystina LaAM-08-1]
MHRVNLCNGVEGERKNNPCTSRISVTQQRWVRVDITDVKVPARARAMLDETNAKRGLVDRFERVRGLNDHPVPRGVVYRLRARRKRFTNGMSASASFLPVPSWGLIVQVDVPLDVGDEGEIRGYHELDRDGRSKALVNGHITRCCVANKVAGMPVIGRNFDQRVHIDVLLENIVMDRTTRHWVRA